MSQQSGVQIQTSRENLNVSHERLHDRQLWEEAHGSCISCHYDSNNDQVLCSGCINGGGKHDHYKEKVTPRRRKLRSMVR